MWCELPKVEGDGLQRGHRTRSKVGTVGTGHPSARERRAKRLVAKCHLDYHLELWNSRSNICEKGQWGTYDRLRAFHDRIVVHEKRTYGDTNRNQFWFPGLGLSKWLPREAHQQRLARATKRSDLPKGRWNLDELQATVSAESD